jgi:hypothetical protein
VKSDAPETKAKSGELIAKGCFYAFGPLTLATFRWSGAEALSGGILLKQLLAASLQLSAFSFQLFPASASNSACSIILFIQSRIELEAES